jgi:hypothetical protein
MRKPVQEMTLAALASKFDQQVGKFDRHEKGCLAAAEKTREAVEGLTETVRELKKTVDHGLAFFTGIRKSSWRAVWFICATLFAGFVSVIITNINADITAQAQAKATAQTLATATQTTARELSAQTQAVTTKNKDEILKAIGHAK